MRLSEGQIRAIIRRAVRSRILSEGDAGHSYSLSDYGPQAGGPADGEEAAESSDSGTPRRAEEMTDTERAFADTKGKVPAAAIAQLVGVSVERDQAFRPIVGPAVGAGVQRFVKLLHDDLQHYAQVKFENIQPREVLTNWRAVHASVPSLNQMDSSGNIVGTIEFTGDERGLLLYLVALKLASFGRDLLDKECSRTDGLVRMQEEDVNEMSDRIFGSTGEEDLRIMLATFKKIAVSDAPDMHKTRVFLAAFARENTTTGEFFGGAVTALGITAGIIAAILALPEVAGGSSAAWLSGGSIMSALGTGLGAISLKSAVTMATGAALGWLGSEELLGSMMNSECYMIRKIMQSTSAMSELSEELRSTWGFGELTDAAEIFAKAVDAAAASNRVQCLSFISDAEQAMRSF